MKNIEITVTGINDLSFGDMGVDVVSINTSVGSLWIKVKQGKGALLAKSEATLEFEVKDSGNYRKASGTLRQGGNTELSFDSPAFQAGTTAARFYDA
jgi:hypothetical protein